MVEENKSTFFHEAITIGAFTAFAYIAGYLYELGYKEYYHLPDMFVEIGLTTIVKSTWAILKALSITLITVNLISYASTKELKFASSAMDYANYLIFFCFFYNVSSNLITYTFAIIALLLIIINYIFPRIKNEKIKRFSQNLHFLNYYDGFGAIKLVRTKYGLKASLIVFFCIIIMGNMYLIREKGKQDAEKEQEYLVAYTPTPMIVIDSYKDGFILAPVDLDVKTFTPKFKFLRNTKENSELPMLEWKKIGPLKEAK